MSLSADQYYSTTFLVNARVAVKVIIIGGETMIRSMPSMKPIKERENRKTFSLLRFSIFTCSVKDSIITPTTSFGLSILPKSDGAARFFPKGSFKGLDSKFRIRLYRRRGLHHGQYQAIYREAF